MIGSSNMHVIIVTRNQNKKENDFHNQNFHNQIYDHYHSNSLMERINKKKQLSRNISFKIKHRFTLLLTKFNYYLVSKIPIDSDG